MRILIQKYGGTSIRDLPSINNLISHVKKCIAEGNKLVIVVSAMGRMGDPYATDTLIQKLEKVNKEIDPKKKDLIMSCGETISASIISHLLDTESIPSEALMGFQAGILTAGKFTDSEIIDIDINNKVELLKLFQDYSESKQEYDQVKTAIKMVKQTGYGIPSVLSNA